MIYIRLFVLTYGDDKCQINVQINCETLMNLHLSIFLRVPTDTVIICDSAINKAITIWDLSTAVSSRYHYPGFL